MALLEQLTLPVNALFASKSEWPIPFLWPRVVSRDK
jgi:hypothetical protein